MKLRSRPLAFGLLFVSVVGFPAGAIAQADSGQRDLSEKIDDAVIGLTSDRGWVAPGRPEEARPLRLGSYDPAVATAAAAHRRGGWTYSLTPYFWAPGMSGDVTVHGQTVDVDLSIAENLENTIDNFDFALMLRFEANHCKWSIIGNLIYIAVGNEDTIGAAAPIDVDWKSTTLIAEGFAGYRFATLPMGCGDACFKPTVTFDALGGVRVYNLGADIDLDPGPSEDGNQTWADPVVGIRALFHATPSLTFNVFANVGGFGIGSDLSWELLAGVSWRISNCVSLDAGWAILDIDYENGSFGYDVTMSGPYLGATFRF